MTRAASWRRLLGVPLLYLVTGALLLVTADWSAAVRDHGPQGLVLAATGLILYRLGPAPAWSFTALALALFGLALYQTQWSRLLVIPVGLVVAHRAFRALAGGTAAGTMWLAALGAWLLALAVLLLPAVWRQHGL